MWFNVLLGYEVVMGYMFSMGILVLYMVLIVYLWNNFSFWKSGIIGKVRIWFLSFFLWFWDEKWIELIVVLVFYCKV